MINFNQFPRPYDVKKSSETLLNFKHLVTDHNCKNIKTLIASLSGHSPHLSQMILQYPMTIQSLAFYEPKKILENEKLELLHNAGEMDKASLMSALRQFKAKVSLIAAACEVSKTWTVQESAKHLSDCADLVLQLAVNHVLLSAIKREELRSHRRSQRKAVESIAENSGFVVLALGKLGAQSLNYSSDIDLIFFYDQDKIKPKKKVSTSSLCTKIAQELATILQERTAQGYVYRVDLRLRPNPSTTPPAISFATAEVYYQSAAENWERAAMIKARAVAGDKHAGNDFLSRIRHFMWRRHLDYAAVEDIHAIKNRLLQHYGHAGIRVRGHDIKIGEGGIRSIEFFVQIHQLLFGGRDPSLRSPHTIDALGALAAAGIVKKTIAEQLSDSYIFLRSLEHRIQMINDEQTHTLPTSNEQISHLASFSGFASAKDFEARVLGVLSLVKRHYDCLPGSTEPELNRLSNDKAALAHSLSRLGFSENARVIISKWRTGSYRALRSERARKSLEALLPNLLEIISKSGDCNRTLEFFDHFLAQLPYGIQILSLFRNNPWVLQVIVKILGTAPALAEELIRRPVLIDYVLAPAFFEGLPDRFSLERNLDQALKDTRDYQDTLDVLRRWSAEARFQTGIYVLEGLVDCSAAGESFSNIAEVAIRALAPIAMREFSKTNGKIKNGELAIVALGSFGGKELTFSSDLDLLLLYSAPPSPQLHGDKKVSVGHYYTRYGQYLLTALMANMSSGKLYEVDLRLRPFGRWGPLVITLSAFEEYQKGSAWVYEHMALTRARVVYGSPAFEARINKVLCKILNIKRDDIDLANTMNKTRLKYAEVLKTPDSYDVKYNRGGLLDIDYIIIFHLLRMCSQNNKLLNTNFNTVITKLAQFHILNNADVEMLLFARKLFLTAYGLVKLCHPQQKSNQGVSQKLLQLIADANSLPYKSLEMTFKKTEAKVISLYQKTFIKKNLKKG